MKLTIKHADGTSQIVTADTIHIESNDNQQTPGYGEYNNSIAIATPSLLDAGRQSVVNSVNNAATKRATELAASTAPVAPPIVETVAPSIVETVAPSIVETVAPSIVETVAPPIVETVAPPGPVNPPREEKDESISNSIGDQMNPDSRGITTGGSSRKRRNKRKQRTRKRRRSRKRSSKR
jgi:hypothetical protein